MFYFSLFSPFNFGNIAPTSLIMFYTNSLLRTKPSLLTLLVPGSYGLFAALEMHCHPHVAQTGLQLLCSSDLPVQPP